MSKKRNDTIFSKFKIAKLLGIKYYHLQTNSPSEKEKKQIQKLIEEESSKLLQGNYKLIKADTIDSDSDTYNQDL